MLKYRSISIVIHICHAKYSEWLKSRHPDNFVEFLSQTFFHSPFSLFLLLMLYPFQMGQEDKRFDSSRLV